jgi:transposase
MNIKTIGIDIAKNVFQVNGMDGRGKTVLTKRLSRVKLPEFIATLPPCLIGMEACGSAHYWGRKFKGWGHEVKLMNPYYVKPYIKANKNDANDAEGICEAVTRPSMRSVPIKSVEQQDIQCLHRIRSRVVQERTALVNQIRGLLAEYGIVMVQGISKVRKQLPLILEDPSNELTSLGREMFQELYQHVIEADQKVAHADARIEKLSQQDEVCKRLLKVPGIGPLTATAILAAVGDAKVFKNGRQMAAWLGLVPRQQSSGDSRILLGVSKRGDGYLRSLLVHGARAVVTRAKERSDWLVQLIQRRGKQKAYVALANKNARILWALIAKGTEYNPSLI